MVSSLQASLTLVAWLAQGTDAVLHAPASGTTGWVGVLTTVVGTVASLAVIVLVATLVPAALVVQRAARKTTALVDRLSVDLAPLVQRANGISDNVHFITSSVRRDVRELSRTVQRVTNRVNDGLEASEQRVAELGALLQVAQEELEQAVVSTASTLHGVRAGVTALRGDLLDSLLGRDHSEALENEEEPEDDDRAQTRRAARAPRGPQIRHHPVEEER